jgi:hydroxymethylglutaryl-CoA lyase
MAKTIKTLETPRDAMQGLANFIPTSKKVELINVLLQVGFDILDTGSFVSGKAIPQLADTADVIKQIDISGSSTKLFVLVANLNGAKKATETKKIDYLGFPFSTSETFLMKNINVGFEKGWRLVNEMQALCVKNNKNLMVYLAMAFGNPYGDPVSIEIIHEFADKLSSIGIKIISLSDIIGVASPEMIGQTYALLTEKYPETEFGIHLHIKQNDWHDKIETAYQHGCRIFDGVINGFGGCPMTGYEMLGNLPTGNIIEFAKSKGIELAIDDAKFNQAKILANNILSS